MVHLCFRVICFATCTVEITNKYFHWDILCHLPSFGLSPLFRLKHRLEIWDKVHSSSFQGHESVRCLNVQDQLLELHTSDRESKQPTYWASHLKLIIKKQLNYCSSQPAPYRRALQCDHHEAIAVLVPLLNSGITDRTEGSSCGWDLKSLMLRHAPDLLERKCKPLQKGWMTISLDFQKKGANTVFWKPLCYQSIFMSMRVSRGA